MSRSPRTVLVISLPGIGNTLLFTPALRHLRQSHPTARIDVLVEGRGSVDILRTNPDADAVLNLDAARHTLRAIALACHLRRRGYDLSITAFPSNRPRYNLFTRLVGARRRIIHSYPDCPAPALSFLQTDTVPARRGLHDIVQNLRLVSREAARRARNGTPPRPLLFLTDEDRAFAADFLSRLPPGRPVIAVHPGSSSGRFHRQAGKRWPAEKFARTADLLVERLDAAVLLFCGPDEAELRGALEDSVHERNRNRIYFPQGRLRQIAALIEKADAMVSNDSGLMHMATALRTPVVALFGPTNPERTGPPWEDCTILRAESGCRACLDYPFSTTRSRITCRDFECWEGIEPARLCKPVADLLTKEKMKART